eukprot:1191136-Prorocentrum_minimum.AAC.13
MAKLGDVEGIKLVTAAAALEDELPRRQAENLADLSSSLLRLTRYPTGLIIFGKPNRSQHSRANRTTTGGRRTTPRPALRSTPACPAAARGPPAAKRARPSARSTSLRLIY